MNIFNLVVNFFSNSELRTNYADGVKEIWDKAKQLRSESLIKSPLPAIINDLTQKAMHTFAPPEKAFNDNFIETSKESVGINTNKPPTICDSIKDSERTQHHHLLSDSRSCQVHLKPFRRTLSGYCENFYNPCSTRFANSRLSKYLESEKINCFSAHSTHLAVKKMFCGCKKETDLANDSMTKKFCQLTKNANDGTTRCSSFISTEINNSFGQRLHHSGFIGKCSKCGKCVPVFSKVTRQDSRSFPIGSKSARSRNETNSSPNQSFDQNQPLCTKLGLRKKKLRSKRDRDQCLAKVLSAKKNEQENHSLSFNEEQDVSDPKPSLAMGAPSVSRKIHKTGPDTAEPSKIKRIIAQLKQCKSD